MRCASFLFCLIFLPCLAFTAGCSPEASGGATRAAEAARVAAAGHLRQIHFLGDLRQGLQQAEQTDKPLLVFFNAPECVYCRQMAEETFTDRLVVALAEHFVCVEVQADRAPEVCARFSVTAYPTVQFMSPGGVPLHRLLGKKPAEELAAQMEAALKAPLTQAARVRRNPRR